MSAVGFPAVGSIFLSLISEVIPPASQAEFSQKLTVGGKKEKRDDLFKPRVKRGEGGTKLHRTNAA